VQGLPFKIGLIRVTFQLTYTTLFGAYASFLLLRTGHLTAAFVAHAFCNVMEVPDLSFMSLQHPLHVRKNGMHPVVFPM
jgi:prenyl protein peptidase